MVSECAICGIGIMDVQILCTHCLTAYNRGWEDTMNEKNITQNINVCVGSGAGHDRKVTLREGSQPSSHNKYGGKKVSSKLFNDGLTLSQVIKELKKIEDEVGDVPFYVCSDEEANTTYKGLWFKVFLDAVDIRGVSGSEII